MPAALDHTASHTELRLLPSRNERKRAAAAGLG